MIKRLSTSLLLEPRLQLTQIIMVGELAMNIKLDLCHALKQTLRIELSIVAAIHCLLPSRCHLAMAWIDAGPRNSLDVVDELNHLLLGPFQAHGTWFART